MNPFYVKIFANVCKKNDFEMSDNLKRDQIILDAINVLPKDDKEFIGTLKPVYLDDSSSEVCMHYFRIVSKVFNMNQKQIRTYKEKITSEIFLNIEGILLENFSQNPVC